MYQVQDYYLALKFNQGSRCVRALYRLCTACCMLHNCKNAGVTRGHPYPKIMISFMLVLQHWRSTKYCGYEMMKTNMSMFNEELGELTFSILARSVLADHTKDDFSHMDRLFRLLRVYRDVKSDVVSDTSGSKNSLNWRHKINKAGDEVNTTILFFKKIIRQMVSNTYRSYDGTPKCYSNAQNGSVLKVVPSSPAVYMTKVELDAYVKTQVTSIRADMNSNFLYPYSHIWPECINHDDEHDDALQFVEMNPVEEEHKEEIDSDIPDDLEKKHNSEDEVGDLGNDINLEQDVDDGADNHPDPDHAVNPLDQRGWDAWGTINQQNQMVGKRKTAPVQRFAYDQRRRGGHFPDPSLQ